MESYIGLCQCGAVRFRIETVLENDMVRGRVAWPNSQFDDFIIARTDGTPLYHFCVVIDDRDMGITHVLRGDDHLSNTAKHLQLFGALGYPLPEFGHLSTICDTNGKKRSKRDEAANIIWYKDQGYLPDAVLNFIARLGWGHQDMEILSRKDLLE